MESKHIKHAGQNLCEKPEAELFHELTFEGDVSIDNDTCQECSARFMHLPKVKVNGNLSLKHFSW